MPFPSSLLPFLPSAGNVTPTKKKVKFLSGNKNKARRSGDVDEGWAVKYSFQGPFLGLLYSTFTSVWK
jgi:hypothetical protein